jgi:hypothetical protein
LDPYDAARTRAASGELGQVELDVPSITVRLARLYIANTAIIVLEMVVGGGRASSALTDRDQRASVLKGVTCHVYLLGSTGD